jgi:hypothetical protein
MAGSEDLRLGVFAGPWQTGHVARDGAVLGFANIERAARRAAAQPGDIGLRCEVALNLQEANEILEFAAGTTGDVVVIAESQIERVA